MTTIYTIGHSSNSTADFGRLLGKWGIGVIVDVRSAPYSGRFPQFQKDQMQTWLPEQFGVEYIWLGKPLGGKDSESSIHTRLQREDGQTAITQLVSLATQKQSSGTCVAIMCSEGYWRNCHRQFIAEHLHGLPDVTVIHLNKDNTTEKHVPLDLPVQQEDEAPTTEPTEAPEPAPAKKPKKKKSRLQ
eukprot:TRINITY_DN67282_c4_g1_i1.p1 TRINITY_DN67282_c4_g1~~TRINITY_DN67282_c4_g1_i1.p1  ORF type:complete len:198 (+),score=19.54 TRINITY_DN67282_c4_g1_i1:36-596(+)